MSFKSTLLVSLLLLSACQPAPISQTTLPTEATLQDFLIQSLREAKPKGKASDKENETKQEKKSSKQPPKLGQHDWREFKPHSGCRRSPELLITDIQLTESGASVFGPTAPAALTPDYAGSPLRLTLKGKFERRGEKELKLKNFLFQYEPPLVQQSFVGKEPKARVLLDDSILLQVETVSATEIVARLNTQLLPDLYLKGNHRLSVELGEWYTDALLNVGEPVPVEYSRLQPQIESVEVLREDDDDRPQHIRLKGKGF
ncbi:hypothetical protein COW36_21675, partial [bacterium (Candidatus Blackallbacteria) CG17_big_fil_post_rev_8_21_14_2_50_48_46]